MLALPNLIVMMSLHRRREVISRLLEVQQRHIIVGDLCRCHEAPDLALPQLLLFALDRPRREADAAFIELARDEHGASTQQEVVACEVVGAAEGGGGDPVAKGEGEDGVIVVV